eukprot:CAMPEP_0172541364 /NCGR_PEP_ID=MMETSP1067-20121228/12192_1 /TAXON_ID=265564 ORGANISM="Thalassiosira punctigera, Strain Tpunct2005C2" /NCGR_SAMPLE_ID=MMETSP1067 /ASSEMBLY_ACC=CAM_ASM_000444 /LENGTH=56 /DNA_ID=CAMNT_0013327393 /DNA_START=49 /DNA_END=215 /DNA_ORIENTATION=-
MAAQTPWCTEASASQSPVLSWQNMPSGQGDASRPSPTAHSRSIGSFIVTGTRSTIA